MRKIFRFGLPTAGVIVLGVAALFALRPFGFAQGERLSVSVRGEPVEPRTATPSPVKQTKKMSEAELARRKEATALQVQFGIPASPQAGSPSEVTLVVLWNPRAKIRAGSPAGDLEVLLRLPAGVRLASEGWEPVDLPQREKQDTSGPWSLYQRVESLSVILSNPTKVLARIPISLLVVEEGVNWVITARTRLGKYTAFGVVFATRQGEKVEFHTTPNVQTD